MFDRLAAQPDADSMTNLQDIVAVEQEKADIYQEAVVQLRRLRPPEGDAEVVDEWLDAFEDLVPLHQQAASAANSDDYESFSTTVDEIVGTLSSARTKGQTIGISCP
jgi:hypothetical protein